jgi:hypothetical protein
MLNAHTYILITTIMVAAHALCPPIPPLPPLPASSSKGGRETPFLLSHPSSVTFLPSSVMIVSQSSQSASFSSQTRLFRPTNILLLALTLLTRPCHPRYLDSTKRHLPNYQANTNLPWSVNHLPSKSLQTCHAEETANEGGGNRMRPTTT